MRLTVALLLAWLALSAWKPHEMSRTARDANGMSYQPTESAACHVIPVKDAEGRTNRCAKCHWRQR